MSHIQKTGGEGGSPGGPEFETVFVFIFSICTVGFFDDGGLGSFVVSH